MRPSFSFPFIKPPNMIPSVDDSLLEVFTPTALPLKPEAPWIKRTDFGIRFSEEILKTEYNDVNLFQADESDHKPSWYNPLIHPIEVKFRK